MSVEKVREYFKKYNIEDRIQEFEESSATVKLAAKALNCEPKRIAKTLSFKIDDKSILIVVAGDAKIDNSKYKAQFNKKAKMLTYEEVLENVKMRDYNDMHKKVGALKKADDAVVIDSTELSIEEVVEKIKELIKNTNNI